MDGKKKWNWTVALCVVLLVLNLWQGKRISKLEQDIWNAQNSIMDNVSRVDQRLASLYSELESADDLVQDWSYASAVNMEKHGLDIKVSLVLKEWQGDTAVKLLCGDLNAPGGEKVVPLSGDGAGAFTGTVELELSGEYTEYTMDAVITNGDTQRRESLGYLGDLKSLLPIRCTGSGYGGPDYRKSTNQAGTVTLSSCVVDLSGDARMLDRITDCVFRLARNGETVAEQATKQGDHIDSYGCGELSAEVQTGDRLTLTFSCRDKYGLGYEFFLYGWKIAGERDLERFAPEVDFPKLTWN